jgi:ActR/RegA family two-component response regulator
MSYDVINILLIEDEDPHAELIQRAFEDQELPVLIHRVRSLTEARASMLVQEPALIIADWRLPDGESMELLPNHQDPLAIPIILMTSYGNERIAVEALKSGALDYVVKSPESMLDMPHLAERAIEQWVARAERVRMQRALLESEAQFRLLAENASDMISRLGTDGQCCMFHLHVKPFSDIPPKNLPALSALILSMRQTVPSSRAFLKGSHWMPPIRLPIVPCIKMETIYGLKPLLAPYLTVKLVIFSKCKQHPVILLNEKKGKEPCKMLTIIYGKRTKEPLKAGCVHSICATVKRKAIHNALLN